MQLNFAFVFIDQKDLILGLKVLIIAQASYKWYDGFVILYNDFVS